MVANAGARVVARVCFDCQSRSILPQMARPPQATKARPVSKVINDGDDGDEQMLSSDSEGEIIPSHDV